MLVGMEIDPEKMDEAADPKVNTLQLWLTAQKIFSAVTRSTPDMPQELAEMLVYVHDLVKDRFPGEEVYIFPPPQPQPQTKLPFTNMSPF